MNLLFFHYSMQYGGAERTIALLSNYVSSQGDVVTIVTMDEKPSVYPLHPSINHIRLNISRQSKNTFEAIERNLCSIKKIKAAYMARQPDVVVCFGPNSTLLSLLARGGMKYKIIGSERSNPFDSKSNFWSKSKRRISTLCDGFLFQTEGARAYYPLSIQNKSIVLPNSIAASDFGVLDRPWKERKDICAVGRMDEGKGFDDIINVFAKIHEKYPQVRLDLYGDGPCRLELEAMSAKLGLEQFIVFHGRCRSILEEYANHKIFVMASRREGMPNVLLEALASGCACVSTDCDFGPSELIRDGDNGFLVPVNDTDTMAGKICLLLDDDRICQMFSKRAQLIRKTNDIEIIGKVFYSYLNRM